MIEITAYVVMTPDDAMEFSFDEKCEFYCVTCGTDICYSDGVFIPFLTNAKGNMDVDDCWNVCLGCAHGVLVNMPVCLMCQIEPAT